MQAEATFVFCCGGMFGAIARIPIGAVMDPCCIGTGAAVLVIECIQKHTVGHWGTLLVRVLNLAVYGYVQEQKDPMLFAKRVRQILSKEMGAPLVEQVGHNFIIIITLVAW